MLLFVSNIKEVSARLVKRLNAIHGPDAIDKMTRTVGITIAAEMRERIHERGEDSSGNQIGDYSPSYLITRQRKYNRTSDPKVILSLTRQMENDFTTGPNNPDPEKTQAGHGIGFKNPVNFQKSKWCEETYGKDIYKTTVREKEIARDVAIDFIKNNLNKAV